MRVLQRYIFAVNSARSSFSVNFTARNDDEAVEYVTQWARKTELASDCKIKITCADGSDVAVFVRCDPPEIDV